MTIHCLCLSFLCLIYSVLSVCRDTVFILGPSHHVYLNGCALTQTSEYETPLYNLTIDQESKLHPLFLLLLLCYDP